MKLLTVCVVFLVSVSCFSKDNKKDLPYYEIPDYPK